MKMKKRTKRVIALVCTLVMIISMIPAEFTKNVMATTLEKCTVTLKDNTNIKDATVSLINNATSGKESVTISNTSIATFENIIDPSATYTLEVTPKDTNYGSKYAKNVEFADDTNYDVDMQEFDYKGYIKDKDNNPLSNATVNVKDVYGNNVASKTTDSNGYYFMKLYKNTTYSVEMKCDGKITKKISNMNSYTVKDGEIFTLDPQKFTISILDAPNGEVTVEPSNTDIPYNSNNTKIKVNATTEGYVIDSLAIKPENADEPIIDCQDAVNEKTFEYSMPAIRENYTVSATFAKQKFEVNYNINEGGKVEDLSEAHTEISAKDLVEYGSSYGFKVVPNEHYHIKSVFVDGNPVTLNDQKIFTISNKIKENHSVQVNFEIDQFTINLNIGDHGKVKYNGVEYTKDSLNKSIAVGYGSNLEFFFEPDYCYDLAGLKVKKSSTEGEGVNATIERNGNIQKYVLSGVSDNYTLNVSFLPYGVANESSINVTSSNEDCRMFKNGRDLKYVTRNTDNVQLTITPVGHSCITVDGVYAWESITRAQTSKYNFVGLVDYGSIGNILTARLNFDNVSLVIDKERPTVKCTTDLNKYYRPKQVICGSVDEPGESGLWEVRYSRAAEVAGADKYTDDSTSTKIVSNDDNSWEFTCNETTSGTYTYYVWAYDYAYNKSEFKGYNVKIDAIAPTISTSYNPPADAVNKKKTVKIPVKLQDEEGGSGVCKICYTDTGNSELFKNDTLNKNDDSNVTKVDVSSTGETTIEVNKNDTFSGDYLIWGYDNAGNRTDKYLICHVVFDNSKPVITIDRTRNEDEWTKDKITLTGTVTDEGGSASTFVRYTTDENVFNNRDKDAAEVANVKDGKYAIELDQSYEGYYYLWAEDSAGNPSDNTLENAKVKVLIDKTNPIITDYKFSNPDQLFNYKAGLFKNSPITVEVKATDKETEDIPSSGLKDIKLHTINPTTKKDTILEIKTWDDSKGTATFELPVGFYGTIFATAEDKVLNQSSVSTDKATYPTAFNVNKNGLIMIENKAPVTTNTVNGTNGFQNYYYSDNPTVNFDFTDKNETVNSGLRTVQINVKDPNGSNIKKVDDEFADETILEQKSYSIKTAEISQMDGVYELKATATDNAGNPSKEQIVKIYKDSTAPLITKFDFVTAGNKEANDKEEAYTPQVKPYGYYFSQDAQVVITARDQNEGSSGVSAINYYLVDENGKISNVNTVKVDANNQIHVNIPKDFKGQIFANAVDYVKNVSEYVTPGSLVIESPAKNLSETHVKFDRNATQTKDGMGYDLYSGDTAVLLTATDSYSGIRKIEWWVTAPYDTDNNQSGVVELNNDLTFTNGVDNGWSKAKTDSNLVTEMNKSIIVKNNSNNIIVRVRVTDRAGNVSEQETQFSIDKTAPDFTVTYDNNTADNNYNYIYKNDRTATIVVKERNFDEAKVVSSITNADGIEPKLSAWTHTADTQNPDNNTHVATITYDSDGDYTFMMSMSDAALNASPTNVNESFTIDKTLPMVGVSYDNNDGESGNYYKASRTATITIYEHNFDPARVAITGTASDDGQQISFPELNGWSNNGDEHVATINYVADGTYAFDIAFADMAGNNADALPHDEFVVDKTMPELQITGVEDRSANKGSIIPVVTFTDVNFDEYGIAMTLTGAKRGNVDVDGTYADTTHGKVFTFKDFENVKEMDDIYTLTANITDRAGNQTSQTITFSVNRYGSVYTIEDKTKEIEGKYVKKTGDIILYETNVDTIDLNQLKVKVVKNGNPIDLTTNKDYTVEKAGGDGQWSQYKYTISKDLFVEDGKYSIFLYSIDAAGNINENNAETKQAEITFGVDNTKPIIIPVDLKNNKQYAVNEKKASVTVKDNLVLGDVNILLNGKAVKYSVDGDSYSFAIPQSDTKQTISITAADAAGNELKVNVKNVLVSTNVFVRWYNNTPLFIGSIVTVCVVIAGVVLLIVLHNKKKNQ